MHEHACFYRSTCPKLKRTKMMEPIHLLTPFFLWGYPKLLRTSVLPLYLYSSSTKLSDLNNNTKHSVKRMVTIKIREENYQISPSW